MAKIDGKTLPFYTTNVPCEDCKFSNWDASLFKDREGIQWEGMLIPPYSEQFDFYCSKHERFYLEDEITGDCQDGEYGSNNLHDVCKEHRRKINEFYKELKRKNKKNMDNVCYKNWIVRYTSIRTRIFVDDILINIF